MQKQTINYKQAEKVYVLAQNVSGATLSADAAVFYDSTSAISDEIGISGAVTSKAHLFAGRNDQSLSDGSKGLVQVYGMGDIYLILSDTAASAVPGDQLVSVTSQTYLVDFSATSLVTGAVENYVTLCETYSAAAGGQSTAVARAAFIRAM